MMKTTTIRMSNRDAMRVFALLLAFALMLGSATAARAAPGDPDPGFDEDGKVATNFTEGPGESGLDVAVQEDGKAVVAGNIYRGSANGYDFALARYNPDGSLDTAFGSGGRVVTPVGAGGSGDEAYGVAVRPDGKIVAAGFTDNSGTNIDFAAVRYNPDGSLDTTFGTGGKVITPVTGTATDYAVDVAARGTKTVLIGRTAQPTHNDFAAVRLNDDGTLDTTFDTDGIATLDFSSGSDDFGEDVAIEPSGKLVIAGLTGVTGSPSTQDFAVARLNADGSPDTTFHGDGKVTTHFGSGADSAYAVVVGEDGKIVVGGKATNGSREDYALARYRPNGSLDDEFDFDGKVTTEFGGVGGWLWDLAMQDDGRVVAAGTSSAASTGANMALARYNPDGSLNSSFSHDGKVMTDFFGFSDEARSVAIGQDGRIVAAGIANGSPTGGTNFAVAQYFGGNDATPPRVRAPEQSLVAGSTLGDPEVPVKLSWSATDAEGEVTGYGLQQSTDGGAYEEVGLASSATTTRTLGLAPGSNYRFRVRATDDTGNRSVWKYGPRFTLDALQEHDSVAYAKTWKTQTLAGAYGGQVMYATAKGAKATLSFTGTEVAWVAPKSKTRGKAAVYLDGVRVATVDLFSAGTLARQVVFSKGNLDPATPHTLEVRNLGTSGRPRVDMDAFVVLR